VRNAAIGSIVEVDFNPRMIEESAASEDDARHATLADDAALDFGLSAATDAKSSRMCWQHRSAARYRWMRFEEAGKMQGDNTTYAEPLYACSRNRASHSRHQWSFCAGGAWSSLVARKGAPKAQGLTAPQRRGTTADAVNVD